MDNLHYVNQVINERDATDVLKLKFSDRKELYKEIKYNVMRVFPKIRGHAYISYKNDRGENIGLRVVEKSIKEYGDNVNIYILRFEVVDLEPKSLKPYFRIEVIDLNDSIKMEIGVEGIVTYSFSIYSEGIIDPCKGANNINFVLNKWMRLLLSLAAEYGDGVYSIIRDKGVVEILDKL